ncbi:uncharacterized protein LOC115695559 [Cannabis sativa]|uniref:uncharacterized protein LOC115695559 n=1 Tax=Cannabis sativa TaxID=3483 RepID=UPI0029C9E362|nr:uncharacterized protein LOC115695559 [Cannabis sativa]
MRGVAWNCRGLGQTSTVRELKSLVRSCSPDFVFLSKLKVDTSPLVRIFNSLIFICVSFCWHCGGIILAWRMGFDFETISISKNHITGLVYSDPCSHPWLLSCVYGPPYFYAKKKFWSEIIGLGDRFGGPWLILGDMNFILQEIEREGSKGRDQFIPVIDGLVNSRGLINLPIQGDNLTWDNHRSGRNHVKSALDKALANQDWINLFPRATIYSFQTCNSDHRPLCLYSCGLADKFKRSFKFEEGWTRDDWSKMVVDHAWKSILHLWPPARIFKKIGATRVALSNWNRAQFGNIDSTISDLEKKLDALQKIPAGSRDWREEQDVRRSLNVYWEKKEGRRNAIESILSKDNIWLTRRDLIGQEFLNFFGEIFAGSSIRRDINCNNLIRERISSLESEELLRIPSHDDIRKTLFSMGSGKALGPDANKIKPILPRLICPTQAAFVPGRSIQDNNVIVQEIIHTFNRKKGKEGLFAIKIDLMKAYDMLSWQFIRHVLECYDIPTRFCNWVDQCITTTTLNVCLNGGQVGKIKPSCGLRQGDPLSPYLFIWAAELLSCVLNEALGKGVIKGIRLSQKGLMCKKPGECGIVWKNSVRGQVQTDIKLNLGIGDIVTNTKYLGLPLFRSRQKDADYNFILDNLTSKLQGSKAKSLSKAGQATLIKSVGLAMPCYAMQTTKLSNRLMHKIDGMVREFWWGFEKGNHGLHLKAWDKLCLPKSRGGMGFQKTKEMNLAFLTKWGWNLLNGGQSLCCKILEAKYLRGKDFLSCRYKDTDS